MVHTRSAITIITTTFLLFASTALATYNEFYFSTFATAYKCPGSPFACNPPQACVHETLLDKWYCCAPGQGSVCWSPDQGCNGTASENEIACGSGDHTYCCLKDREECTQTSNQFNICWATANTNAFENATSQKMNKTFSSLSSASPSATSLVFNLAQILPSTSSSARASSTTQTSGSPSTSTNTAKSTSTASSSNASTSDANKSSLSGGAIAGIVIGVILGLAVLIAAAFFLLKRGKNKKPGRNELDGNPYPGGGYVVGGGGNEYGNGNVNGTRTQEKYAHEMPVPPSELDSGSNAPVEIGPTGGGGGGYEHEAHKYGHMGQQQQQQQQQM
ncbi:hypothetical protein K504DRAFT_496340 [Pleomassaria siparia CBS 279.74]|uniref:Mid2 domain-containing protein n=1 Tax=Pleomassaria siparia CBS 279.74 TaxID=1314801 RepID=A0A6G1KPU6_9PLEO|nr:hypothetical protein K504DRAFT_496340 [Pleomassaria siparia CBS 279.74]